MSSPTVSASSIGPIGMPKASAASSTVSGAMPSSTQRIAAIRYGREHPVDQEARRALHRQRQLVDLAHERGGAARPGRRGSTAPTTISTSIIWATGLKKWMPMRREPVVQRGGDVLQRDARRVGARGSRPASPWPRAAANSARLASRFSKIASMMTSARATPSPATSGIRRSVASRTRRGVLQALGEELRRARHRRREPPGVLVLQRHRESAQRAPGGDVAAHGAGADDVDVRRLELAVLAQRLQPLLQPEHADEVAPPSASSATR